MLSERETLAARLERWFELPVLVAAILVIPVIVIEESANDPTWRRIGEGLNWAIWATFAAEFLVLFAVTPRRGQWLRGHLIELAVVLLTPPFLPASLQAARLVRLLRLVRLAQVAKVGKRLFSLEGVKVASFLALLVVLGGGAAYTAAENGQRLADGTTLHRTTWDGVWWSVVTITSVGYGDIYPVTTLGRVIAIVVMIVGLGFLAILTAALAERFLSQRVHTEVAAAEQALEFELGTAEAGLLAETREIGRRLQRLEQALVNLQTRRAPESAP